ncbi:hypothetical protein BJX76DRAFT_39319 [Aspergillus varians]
MEVWPTRHDSLHDHHHHHHLPPPDFPHLSQSSPTLPIEPLVGYSGVLSLRNYRKSLSHGTASLLDAQEGKTLRRKNAAANLNQTTAQMGTVCQNAYYYHSSPSSATPSPPPDLSPSYSPSALSEQLPELLDGYGYPLSPVLDSSQTESFTANKQNPYKLLDTFRDRLDKFSDPDIPDVVEFHRHSRAQSDSVLFKTRRARKPPATATVVHQGTSFEILNPHESLDFARIVSYIEDVDSHSASNHRRDSYLNSSDSSNIIQEEPYEASPEVPIAEERVHNDLVGDSPHHPMPSISERLEEKDAESCYSSTRPLSRPLSRPMSRARPWTAHNDTDLGEPGPPISFEDDSPVPLPSSPDFDPIQFAALYDVRRLPPQGKGAGNPTAIIYSDHKPLRKRSTTRKSRKTSSPSPFSFSSSAAATASAPLKRLRGIAQSLRRKTFPRASLS